MNTLNDSLKRCLIVEDLPATAQWLCDLVEHTFPGVQIKHCANFASATRELGKSSYDLALLDLGLPDGNGVDLIRKLADEQPKCLRIVTTIYTDDHHVFPALRAGAQGYILKDQPPERVGQALMGITLGEPPLSPTIARRLLRVFSDQEGATSNAARLTPRETQTLTLVAKGLKIGEVAEHLSVTTNTAAGYVKSVYRKLNVSSRAEATIEAVRMGLVKTEL